MEERVTELECRRKTKMPCREMKKTRRNVTFPECHVSQSSPPVVFALKKETVVAEKQKKSPTRKETDLLESNIATGTAHLVDRLGVLALRAGGHHVTGLLAPAKLLECGRCRSVEETHL